MVPHDYIIQETLGYASNGTLIIPSSEGWQIMRAGN